MSILVNKNTRVLTQGITGATGQFHTRACKEYGTQMVAGVTPGKGGTSFEGIPIFDTVARAVKETGANASVIYVPPAFAADAILEAADADIPLAICITEGIPVRDMVKVKRYLEGRKSRLLGPELSRNNYTGRMQNRHYAGPYSSSGKHRGGVSQRDTDLRSGGSTHAIGNGAVDLCWHRR
jgi:succinyl-CoA synthetase alpha subunit